MSDLRDQVAEAKEPEAENAEVVKQPKTAPACLNIDPNGATVFIEYYPELQRVQVDYDRTKIKTWDMIIGILEMGILQAKTRREMVIAGNINKQQQEQLRKQREAFETQLMAQHLEAKRQNGPRIVT